MSTEGGGGGCIVLLMRVVLQKMAHMVNMSEPDWVLPNPPKKSLYCLVQSHFLLWQFFALTPPLMLNSVSNPGSNILTQQCSRCTQKLKTHTAFKCDNDQRSHFPSATQVLSHHQKKPEIMKVKMIWSFLWGPATFEKIIPITMITKWGSFTFSSLTLSSVLRLWLLGEKINFPGQ